MSKSELLEHLEDLEKQYTAIGRDIPVMPITSVLGEISIIKSYVNDLED